MGVSILDNWQYLGKKPDFTRQLFETVADMVAFNENYLAPVYECNVIEDGCRYRYQLTNDLDPDLGRWRKVEGGSGTVEEAEDVGYENEKLPDVVDIKQALDELVECQNSGDSGRYRYRNLDFVGTKHQEGNSYLQRLMEGIIIGISTFLIIGLFHPVVIKAEYYWGTRCWWVFLWNC